MTLKITPGSIVSDGHVVLLPAGVTGEVTLDDGTTYNLGPATQNVIEVDSHEHALETALRVSDMVGESEDYPDVQHDRKLSERNFRAVRKG